MSTQPGTSSAAAPDDEAPTSPDEASDGHPERPPASEQAVAERPVWETLRPGVIGEAITWGATWAARWLLIALGLVLAGLVVRETWSVLLPLLLALVIGSVLQAPARSLERRLHLPRTVAAAFTIVVAVAVLGGTVSLLAPTASEEVVELSLSASSGLGRLEDFVRSSGIGVTDAQIESAVTSVQNRLQSSAATIASGVLVGLSVVLNAIINVVITLVLVFFILKDGHRFLPWLDHWSGQAAGRHLTEVSIRAWTTLGTFVRTQALVGLIDAVFIGAGLLVIGVPLALPLAALTFLAAFAPIVGAVTVGALAVLVALAANGWFAALLVLAIVLLVQQLEGNVLLPWLQGRSLDLHAGVVLLSIVLGSTLFGVIGAFLAVPAAAVGCRGRQIPQRAGPGARGAGRGGERVAALVVTPWSDLCCRRWRQARAPAWKSAE